MQIHMNMQTVSLYEYANSKSVEVQYSYCDHLQLMFGMYLF